MRVYLLAVVAATSLAGSLASVPALAAPADVAEQRREVAALGRELASVDAQAGAAAAAHNRALDRRDAVRARITATVGEIRTTERQLGHSRELLSRRLVQVYVDEAPGPIDVLLQSGSLTDALAIGTLLERAADADAAVVTRIRERRAELAGLRVRLAADARAAQGALDTARVARARVEGLLAVRRRAVAAAQERLGELLAAERRRIARAAAQKRVARAAARHARASTAIASSRDQPTSGSPTPAVPAGSHVFPLAGPTTFSDDWLASRPGGRYHEGIDLFAARGTPVVAVADGTLYRVGYSGISGNRLWLRDGAGTAFFYAHLDGYSAAAREGATVSRGAVLGYNGDTGDARGTPPHVHFEIHPGGGGPVRPYPIVSGWPRAG